MTSAGLLVGGGVGAITGRALGRIEGGGEGVGGGEGAITGRALGMIEGGGEGARDGGARGLLLVMVPTAFPPPAFPLEAFPVPALPFPPFVAILTPAFPFEGSPSICTTGSLTMGTIGSAIIEASACSRRKGSKSCTPSPKTNTNTRRVCVSWHSLSGLFGTIVYQREKGSPLSPSSYPLRQRRHRLKLKLHVVLVRV
jgi:hypothetical protein